MIFRVEVIVTALLEALVKVAAFNCRAIRGTPLCDLCPSPKIHVVALLDTALLLNDAHTTVEAVVDEFSFMCAIDQFH